MLPTIALVGRPNVGKSTLFNRLTKSRNALVADFPGLTRDRQYGQGRVGERRFVVIDTGGFEPIAKEGILKEMARQTLQALDEADIVIFLVDGRAGVTPQDARIADLLRKRGRTVYLAVNKTEGMNDARVTAEFYELGIGEPYAISATQGDRVNALLELALHEKAPIPGAPEVPDEDEPAEPVKLDARGKMVSVGEPGEEGEGVAFRAMADQLDAGGRLSAADYGGCIDPFARPKVEEALPGRIRADGGDVAHVRPAARRGYGGVGGVPAMAFKIQRAAIGTRRLAVQLQHRLAHAQQRGRAHAAAIPCAASAAAMTLARSPAAMARSSTSLPPMPTKAAPAAR